MTIPRFWYLYLIAGLAALTAGIIAAVLGTGWAVTALVVMLIAPDVPLLFGMGRGIERGRLAPRAVPYYNATHRLVGSLVTLAVSLVVSLAVAPSWTLAAAGFAWLAHVLIDRSVGYG